MTEIDLLLLETYNIIISQKHVGDTMGSSVLQRISQIFPSESGLSILITISSQ